MKKILIFLSLLAPFLVRSQDSVYLYGSTTDPKNKVIARNDFQVNHGLYLGVLDTLNYTPPRAGVIVTRPQDGNMYYFTPNAGGQQWSRVSGVQNIYPKNGIHYRNDSSFALGGKMDSTTLLEFSNAEQITFDSAAPGTSSGFRVNFVGDQPWDMFFRDSVSGYWNRLAAGTVGQVLTRAASGGYVWTTPAAGGQANLSISRNIDSANVSNSNGTGFAIYPATHLLAGLITAASQSRLDSTINVANPENVTGDTLFVASLGKDSLIARRISLVATGDLLIADSGSTYQIYKTFRADTSSGATKLATQGFITRTYQPAALAQGSIWVGNSSGVGAALAIGTNGQVPISNGTTVAWGNQAAGFANPMTTLGQIIYQGSSGPLPLSGNSAASIQILASEGNGSVASAPLWYTPGAGDVTAWLGYTPENIGNKSTITTLGTSNTLYPSQNAVKTYVDNQASATLTLTNKTMSGASNSFTNIPEIAFAFTNVTTANATTSAHGLLPILPNVATEFLNGVGGWAVPAGTNIYNTDGTVSSSRTVTLNSNTVKFTGGKVDIDASSFYTSGQSIYGGTTGAGLFFNNSIYDNGFTGSGGTRVAIAEQEIAAPSISALNTNVTFTNAATLYLDGPPNASTNVTIDSAYTIYVNSGNIFDAGNAIIGGRVTVRTIDSTATPTGGYVYRDPVTGLFKLTNNSTQLTVNNGLTGNGTTIGLGGTFTKDDTLGLNTHSLYIQGLPNKIATSTDSAALIDANGKIWKIPIYQSSNSFTPVQISGIAGTVYSSTYIQIGNVVEVNGMFGVPSGHNGANTAELAVPVPLGSQFTANSQVLGSTIFDIAPSTLSTGLYLGYGTGSSGAATIVLHWNISDGNAHTFSYHYSYFL